MLVLGVGNLLHVSNLRRSKLLDALAGEPLTHVNAVVKRLARDNTCAEATGKSITVGLKMLVSGIKEGSTFRTYPAPLVSLMASLEIS